MKTQKQSPTKITLNDEDMAYINEMAKGITLRRNLKRDFLVKTGKVAKFVSKTVTLIVNSPRTFDKEGIVLSEIISGKEEVINYFDSHEAAERAHLEAARKGTLLGPNKSIETLEDLSDAIIALGGNNKDVRQVTEHFSKEIPLMTSIVEKVFELEKDNSNNKTSKLKVVNANEVLA